MLGGRAADPLVEVELERGLHHLTIERRAALEEYLRYEVPGLFPAATLARSATFQAFVDAAPGMSDLLAIGKVWELLQRPGTSRTPRIRRGHPRRAGERSARRTARAPRTSARSPGSGPWRGRRQVGRSFATRAVGVVVVATPEQMAVSEALALQTTLAERFGIELDAVVANRVSPPGSPPRTPSPSPERRRIPASFRALVRGSRQGAAGTARTPTSRPRSSACTTLPFRFEAELEHADVERFADLLGRPVVAGWPERCRASAS